jgi:hypothetical protein
MDIKIIIAAHKPYELPSDSVYLPLQVGAEGKSLIDGFTPDNIERMSKQYLEWARRDENADD